MLLTYLSSQSQTNFKIYIVHVHVVLFILIYSHVMIGVLSG